SSMHYPETDKKKPELQNKITFSIYCCAAIMNLLKMQRDAVGLSIFSDNIETHTPSKSSTVHHKLLYHKLEEALNSSGDIKRKTSAASALHEIAENIHKRSLVIVFSDMFENAGDDSQ